MEYVYFVTPQPRPVPSLDETMLPERSIKLRFADLAASMRDALPEGASPVAVTQLPATPRIGRLVIVTSADKSTVDDALAVALVDALLVLTTDPSRA